MSLLCGTATSGFMCIFFRVDLLVLIARCQWNNPDGHPLCLLHYGDVTMGVMASQITSLTIVYSAVYSGTNRRKHQSSVSLAFVRGIHRGPVNSPHKGPVTRKIFPFDDVIMKVYTILTFIKSSAVFFHFFTTFLLSNHFYFIKQSACFPFSIYEMLALNNWSLSNAVKHNKAYTVYIRFCNWLPELFFHAG